MRIAKLKKVYTYRNVRGKPHDIHEWPLVKPGYRYLKVGEVFNKETDLISHKFLASCRYEAIFTGYSDWVPLLPEYHVIPCVDENYGYSTGYGVRCITPIH